VTSAQSDTVAVTLWWDMSEPAWLLVRADRVKASVHALLLHTPQVIVTVKPSLQHGKGPDARKGDELHGKWLLSEMEPEPPKRVRRGDLRFSTGGTSDCVVDVTISDPLSASMGAEAVKGNVPSAAEERKVRKYADFLRENKQVTFFPLALSSLAQPSPAWERFFSMITAQCKAGNQSFSRHFWGARIAAICARSAARMEMEWSHKASSHHHSAQRLGFRGLLERKVTDDDVNYRQARQPL